MLAPYQQVSLMSYCIALFIILSYSKFKVKDCSWVPLCKVERHCWYKYRNNKLIGHIQDCFIMCFFELLFLSLEINTMANCHFTISNIQRKALHSSKISCIRSQLIAYSRLVFDYQVGVGHFRSCCLSKTAIRFVKLNFSKCF